MRFIIYVAILLISLPVLAGVDKVLQNQLLKMAEQNQEIHQSLDKYESGMAPLALQTVATEIDNIHTQTLKEIVALFGWPNKEQVGEKGVQAAFVLTQHSNDLIFQQDMLPLIIQSYLNKDGIAGPDVAQFTDQVSIKSGKKQVFGTQISRLNGEVIFLPIQNEQTVNKLRAQMGMSTLQEYKKTLESF